MTAGVMLNVIGHPGSGKSKVCEYLVNNHGFETYRPSDTIRNYAASLGILLSGRKDYAACNIAMVERDPNAMIQPALDSEADRLCLDGLRSPHNVSTLQAVGMQTLALVADPELRYRRVADDVMRKGHRKPPTFEAFIADESTDNNTTDPRLPNTEAIIDTAEYTIDASEPLAVVYRRTDEILAGILSGD